MRQLHDAEVVVAIRERTRFNRRLLERLPRLRHIAQTGRSTHHIDVAACTALGIAVSAGSHASPHTIAEYTWALILAALRDIAGQAQSMKQGEWSRRIGLGVHGKTLGVHGFGKIGCLVGKIGESFGMRVLAWGGEASRKRASEAGCMFASSIKRSRKIGSWTRSNLRGAACCSESAELFSEFNGFSFLQEVRKSMAVNTANKETVDIGEMIFFIFLFFTDE